MSLLICRHDQSARTGMHRLPVDAGHHATGRPAQGETAGEVHAVLKMPIGDVSG